MVQYTEHRAQNHLYLDDTYLFDVNTSVLEVGENDGTTWVALRDNIFHPQGGGQPADAGWLGEIPVHPLRDPATGMVVVVAADPEQPLPSFEIGETVYARIDEQTRLQHTALHTAGHLIEALVQPQQWRTVGNNHFPGQARVEFVSDDLAGLETPEERASTTERLQHKADDAIRADLATLTHTEADGTRMVEIAGLHSVACGGTHGASLSELHELKIPNL